MSRGDVETHPAGGKAIDGLRAALVVSAGFLAVAISLIFLAKGLGRADYDQNVYHLPAIKTFAAAFPSVDLSDYSSASTPGYHLLLAAVCRWVTSDLHGLRLASSVITVGLLATVAAHVGRRRGTFDGVVLVAPLACSLYVLSAAVWLLPDNLGWWGVAVVLILALARPVDRRLYVFAGMALLATVLARQVHLWAAAPLWLAAWLGTRRSDGGPALLAPQRGAIRRLAMMMVATSFAFAAVGYFVWLWGGTVPPSLRSELAGGNLVVPATILALAGLFTPFFAGYLWPALSANRLLAARAMLVGGILGFIAGVAPESSYDFDAGRRSGLWNLVQRLPVIAGRSPLIVVLSTVGGAAIAACFIALPPRTRWIYLSVWLAFIAAQIPNRMAWQRYYEPLILMLTALTVAHLPAVGKRTSRLAATGVLALSVALAIITALSLG